MSVKDDQLIFRCFECKKNYKKDFKESKGLQIYMNFVMKTLINFVLLLRKSVYPHEYMDSWERFDEASLPDKEAFYSSLNRKILQMLIIGMQKEFSKVLIIKI